MQSAKTKFIQSPLENDQYVHPENDQIKLEHTNKFKTNFCHNEPKQKIQSNNESLFSKNKIISGY